MKSDLDVVGIESVRELGSRIRSGCCSYRECNGTRQYNQIWML